MNLSSPLPPLPPVQLNRMRFRKLRIAFTATCLIACVLLIALWVRSYWRWDSVQWGWGTPTKQAVNCFSQNGIVKFDYDDIRWDQFTELDRWGVRSRIPEGPPLISTVRHKFLGFGYRYDRQMYFVPYWFLVSLTGILTTLPWLPYRFSLRTLLIATTLVAVMLGLIVWAMRKTT